MRKMRSEINKYLPQGYAYDNFVKQGEQFMSFNFFNY